YYHNEFEWKSIREAGRNFLRENRTKFSLRFELMQPLKLGEYDLQTKKFDILDEFQIKGIRRFEVKAENLEMNVCGYGTIQQSDIIPGYPTGLLVELSRPINLTSLQVE